MRRPRERSKTDLDIGGRLRAERARAGLTLDALARASGVSKAMLSQVEQNKANPTVGVLYKIVTALDLDISAMVHGPRGRRAVDVIRGRDARHLFVANRDCTIRTLSPLRLEKDIEFYQVALKPGRALESDAHFRDTEEFLAVSRGRVRVASGGQEAALEAGDSAHYAADVPHAIRNSGRSQAVLYLVVKYRES
jgi:transcriptional regulator with XRE-family HTH domain